MPYTNHPSENPSQPDYARMRRVLIEERQAKILEHVRGSTGYADDVSPHAHDPATFRLINQRKDLDKLPDAAYVVPTLDQWKHWSKMNDWDSRNRLLEQLIQKLRRLQATCGEIQVLVTICRPQWAQVIHSLRRSGGVDFDAAAGGGHQLEEALRVQDLDRDELAQVIHHALLETLLSCPRPFPRFFFKWLQKVLALRALDHIRKELADNGSSLTFDGAIHTVVDDVLASTDSVVTAAFRLPPSPAHSQWLRTLDLPAIFELSKEYATYARTRSACERAVERLPNRQREVIQARYFEAMTQEQVGVRLGLASSTVRSHHSGAISNLRRDDELFDVLEAIGKVRRYARNLELKGAA
jgi:RNA polymerase sigma factor (sigma-70 family)